MPIESTASESVVSPAPAEKPKAFQESPGFSPPENTVASFLSRLKVLEPHTSSDAATDGSTEAKADGSSDDAATEPTDSTKTDSDAQSSSQDAEPEDADHESSPILPDAEKLKALAKDGKYKDILEAVLKPLGIDIDGTKVPASRFAEFRKMQKAEKAKLAARENQIAQYENQAKERVDAVIKEYEGLAKARKAWADGDVIGALEAAFGEDVDSISDKAIKQKLAQDPELAKLKRKLELKEKQEAEEAEKLRLEREKQAHAKAEAQYIGQLREALKESEDATISKLSAYKDFADQVYRCQLHFYRTENRELTPDQAAQKVLQVIRSSYEEITPYLVTGGTQTTVTTDGAGKEPQSTIQAGRSPGTQRTPKGVPQARAASTPAKSTADMSEAELWAHYRDKLRREAAQERLAK